MYGGDFVFVGVIYMLKPINTISYMQFLSSSIYTFLWSIHYDPQFSFNIVNICQSQSDWF